MNRGNQRRIPLIKAMILVAVDNYLNLPSLIMCHLIMTDKVEENKEISEVEIDDCFEEFIEKRETHSNDIVV